MLYRNIANCQRRAFLFDHIIRGVSAKQDRKIGSCVLQCPAEPQDRVVLFFQRASIGALNDIQNSHLFLSYLVGITRVFVDSPAILKKSAGLPRFTPSTTLIAPRSSTHKPQFTHVNCGLLLPISNRLRTNSFVVGCSSCSTVVPFTGFACGA